MDSKLYLHFVVCRNSFIACVGERSFSAYRPECPQEARPQAYRPLESAYVPAYFRKPSAAPESRPQSSSPQPQVQQAAASRPYASQPESFREKPPQSRCSRLPLGSAFDRPHRRARVPPPAQTGPEALRRRWQGIAELFAGNFRSRILFSCVLPSSAKGYVCPDRKRTG